MSSKTPINVAKKIVSQILKINPDDLTESSKIHDFPEWDSLGHLQIVQALEEKLEITIDEEELFDRLTHFKEIELFIGFYINKKGDNHDG